MSVIIQSRAKSGSEWSFENGKEVLYYDKNPITNEVVITSPISPYRHGFNRHKTNQPKEMDCVFRQLHAQERQKNDQLIEKIWTRGRAYYDKLRSNLNQRLLSCETSEWEKSFIRESLRLMNERDFEAQKNTTYGVSAMETTEAPLEGGRTKV
jgi:hypothetical protein